MNIGASGGRWLGRGTEKREGDDGRGPKNILNGYSLLQNIPDRQHRQESTRVRKKCPVLLI